MKQTVVYFSITPAKDNLFAQLLLKELADYNVMQVADENEFPGKVKINMPDVVIVDPGIAVVYESLITATIEKSPTIPFLFAPYPKLKETVNGRKSDPETTIFFTALKNLLASAKAKDISKVTKRLNEAEDRFFQAFYHSPLPMMIVRASDNIIIETNEQILKSLEYPYEGLIGDDASALDTSWTKTHRTEFQIKLSKERIVRNFPMRIRKNTGEEIDTIVFAEAMNVSSTLCYLFIFFDLTELKLR